MAMYYIQLLYYVAHPVFQYGSSAVYIWNLVRDKVFTIEDRK